MMKKNETKKIATDKKTGTRLKAAQKGGAPKKSAMDPEAVRAAIACLYEKIREETRTRWDRDLPLSELLFDRWERAESLGFGAGSGIYHNSYVYGDVKVGQGTWIGPFTLLDGTGGLRIGATCSISAGVMIYTHDTVQWALSGGKATPQRTPVKIGDCCFIGSKTVIVRGVTIGDHCVIGACSFVDTDIPPYSVAVGVPCRVIGKIKPAADGTFVLKLNETAAKKKPAAKKRTKK
jgi:acetyltransferase-like isoleucine patch superfamily enzyme